MNPRQVRYVAEITAPRGLRRGWVEADFLEAVNAVAEARANALEGVEYVRGSIRRVSGEEVVVFGALAP